MCINDILFWLTHWGNWWELGYIDNAMTYVNIRYDKYQYSNIQIYVWIQKNIPTLKKYVGVIMHQYGYGDWNWTNI